VQLEMPAAQAQLNTAPPTNSICNAPCSCQAHAKTDGTFSTTACNVCTRLVVKRRPDNAIEAQNISQSLVDVADPKELDLASTTHLRAQAVR